MIDRRQRDGLLTRRALQHQAHMGFAEIRRNMNVGDRDRAHAGVVQLIIDQFVEFFAKTGRDAFGAAGVQLSG